MTRRRKKRNSPPSDFFKKVKERSVQKKRTIIKILIALAVIFLIYRFFAGPYGFIQIHSLLQEKKNLGHESRLLKAEIVDLEIEKNRLNSDPFYLEKQARERLGLIKEGEKMYRVIHKEKSANPKTLPTPPSDSTSR